MIYDLLIVGGGMSGISVGHFFRNRKILILEKGNLLHEASGKNAGFLISGFGEHYNRTAARWGRERAREIQQIHRATHERIKELSILSGSGYHETGSYQIGMNEREDEDLRLSERMLREDGFPVAWKEEAPSGLNQQHGALYNPQDAWIDPVQFWNNIAGGIPRITGCEVLRIEYDRSIPTVITSAGKFQTRAIVYCLNAFSTDLLPELAGRYIPLRGQIVEIPISSTSTFQGPLIANYGEIYWRFSGDRLIFGGLEYRMPEIEVGIAKKPSRKLEELQLSWIRDHFQLRHPMRQPLPSEFHSVSRCSTMAFTVDGFPFVGQLSKPNEYVLAGLCGLGHSYALECASWLYELIEKNENKIPSYFSAERISRLRAFEGGNWRNLYEAWNH